MPRPTTLLRRIRYWYDTTTNTWAVYALAWACIFAVAFLLAFVQYVAS